MSDENPSFHALFRTFYMDTRDEIVGKAFSKNGKIRLCKSLSCPEVNHELKNKEEAFTHFCSKHLKDFRPYVCACGSTFSHRPSARRHLKENSIPVSEDPFGLPCYIDANISLPLAFDLWLVENKLTGDTVGSVQDTSNGAIENQLKCFTANFLGSLGVDGVDDIDEITDEITDEFTDEITDGRSESNDHCQVDLVQKFVYFGQNAEEDNVDSETR